MSRGYLLVAMLLLVGCNAPEIRDTHQPTPVQRIAVAAPAEDPDVLPETLLPDVGVDYFEVALGKDDTDLVDPAVHEAEARYLPWLLVRTLQNQRQWGAVRVNPGGVSQTDVMVAGRLLESDGTRLELDISVHDATGRRWFQRRYSGQAVRSDYARESSVAGEPFQSVYDRIAEDLLRFRESLTLDELAMMRQISELRFAEQFAPNIFSGYLVQTGAQWRLARAPFDDDPHLLRVRTIRARDYLFVDTLQDYHGAFAQEMESSYYDLRRELFVEGAELRDARQASTLKTLGGALAILTGILAQGSDSAITQAAGVVGIGAGAMVVQDGLRQRSDSRAYADSIREVSGSFAAAMTEHQVSLEDRTVTLTGTIQQQAARWRELLQQIYNAETSPEGTDAAATDSDLAK